MLPLRTILCGTDFSEPSVYAFNLACALARDYRAKLVILHVIPVPIVYAAEGMVDPFPAELRAQAAEKLAGLGAGVIGLTLDRRIEEGDAETEILRVSAELKVDLIVV